MPRASCLGFTSGLRGPISLPTYLSSRLHCFLRHTGLKSGAVGGKREAQMTQYGVGNLQRFFAVPEAGHIMTEAFNGVETDVAYTQIPRRLRGLHVNK